MAHIINVDWKKKRCNRCGHWQNDDDVCKSCGNNVLENNTLPDISIVDEFYSCYNERTSFIIPAIVPMLIRKVE